MHVRHHSAAYRAANALVLLGTDCGGFCNSENRKMDEDDAGVNWALVVGALFVEAIMFWLVVISGLKF